MFLIVKSYSYNSRENKLLNFGELIMFDKVSQIRKTEELKREKNIWVQSTN